MVSVTVGLSIALLIAGLAPPTNAGLLPPDIVAAARLRHSDGAGTGDYLDQVAADS